MRLRLPLHIQDMIQARSLEIDHIKKAIRDPDEEKPIYQNRTLARKRIENNRTVEVIYFKDGFKDSKDYIVVTAYHLDEE